MAGTDTNLTMENRLDHLDKNIDDMFLLFNAIIVSLMQTGFACLEAGCVNSKNVTSIIMKNVLDLFICAICYWLVGYTLAYSPGNQFVGFSWWAGVGVPEGSAAHWFFQFVFAATAATIISGAVAERCNFTAYIVYSSVISGFVYPVASHWAWQESGLLATLGYRDFAGSGVVHAVAGVCSFVAAAFIGPRIGRFENGTIVDKPGHSVPLFGIGGLLLVSGFLAFNGGSLGHISQPGDGQLVARAVTNTIMGGSGAAVVVLVLSKAGLLGPSTWAFSVTLNAVLVGMVSVCAAADIFPTLGAILTGAIACPIYLALRSFVIFLRVDDPLDAVAVHFGGGLWGVIAMPIFSKGGLVYGLNDQSIAQLWHNAVGALLIVGWSGICSVVLFGLLRFFGQLRVSEVEELEGLDISKHNEPAYPEKGWHVTHPLNIHNHNTFKKLDDPLDAVAVHFGGGLWGVIAMPIFSKGGLVYGLNDQSIAQLWHNAVGALLIVGWSGICSVVLFGLLRFFGQLRVSEVEELEGLDISKHNEPAYPEKGWHVTHPLNIHNHNTFKKHGSYSPSLTAFKQPALAFDNMAMEMENHQRLR